jgi:hypothetical protein
MEPMIRPYGADEIDAMRREMKEHAECQREGIGACATVNVEGHYARSLATFDALVKERDEAVKDCGRLDRALRDEAAKADAATARADKAEAERDVAVAKAAVIGGEWCATNRAEGRGPCGSCSWCCAQATARAERAEALLARTMDPIRFYNENQSPMNLEVGLLSEIKELLKL